jgi:hypothetical protein
VRWRDLPSSPLYAASFAGNDDETVQLAKRRPDPFRAEGVPDRLVLVLHREGMHYVGTLSTWEYHEIVVSRVNPHDGKPEQAYEMVVDVARPHTVDVVVRMHQRPTAARVVAELVDVLRGMVSGLAGRDRRRPPRASAPGDVTSGPHETPVRTTTADRIPLHRAVDDDQR